MALRIALLALPILIASGVAIAGEPTAADRETARGLMDRGDELAAKHDGAGALAAFQAAHALMGLPTTGVEVAKAHAAIGHLVEARDVALAVSRLPVAKHEPAAQGRARADAAAIALALAPRIPSLAVTIEGAPADAPVEVAFDGAPVPAAAAQLPRKLDPGRHVVTVACEGFGAERIEVELAEGAALTRTVKLARAAARAPTPPATQAARAPAPEAASASRGGWPVATWIGFGVGAAGLVVGGVAGGLSLSKASALAGACDAAKRCPPSAQSDLDAGKALAIVSDVGFGVAIAGAAVGVIAIVLSKGAPPDRPAASFRVTPSFGPGQLGVMGTLRAF